MFLQILILGIGFVLLIKGADYFVEGASGIAANCKVPKMLIGLTIVAFGTSAPEFAVSIKSMLSGNGDIVLGNVIGSNILNILLILGVSATIHDLTVKSSTVKKELPITMLITILFSCLLCDSIFDPEMVNKFTRLDGIVLLLFFSVFLYYLISMSRKKTEKEEEPLSVLKSSVYTLLGILGIIIGSNLTVDSVVHLANALKISERVISLTIIALGTSLPELVTSIVATKKGEYEIAIGNVVGSNIFNIGVVIGIPVALLGEIGIISFSYIDLFIMVAAAIILFLFSFNDYKISRKEGILFLGLLVAYYSYILIS